jgi:hypothetical protein
MASLASKNKARGRAFQAKLAEMAGGINIGTLGGEDVMHKEFSYEAKTYNKNAKTYKGKEWAGEQALSLFDDGFYYSGLKVLRVTSFNFAPLYLIRWHWWKRILEREFSSEDIINATRDCRKEKFVGNTYMNQAESNCPDAKLPVVVVHTTGKRHESDIVILRAFYWESLVDNYAR